MKTSVATSKKSILGQSSCGGEFPPESRLAEELQRQLFFGQEDLGGQHCWRCRCLLCAQEPGAGRKLFGDLSAKAQSKSGIAERLRKDRGYQKMGQNVEPLDGGILCSLSRASTLPGSNPPNHCSRDTIPKHPVADHFLNQNILKMAVGP